jgi:hypothetical protein
MPLDDGDDEEKFTMQFLPLGRLGLAGDQEYPAVRVGGVFAIGLGLLVLTSARVGDPDLNVPIYLGGTILLSGLVLFNRPLRRWLAFGRQSREQKQMVKVAVVIAGILTALTLTLFGNADPRFLALMLLVIAAIYMLPLGFAYSPLMTAAGALCLVNALVGIWLASFPLSVVFALDGILKLGFGTLMLSAQE